MESIAADVGLDAMHGTGGDSPRRATSRGVNLVTSDDVQGFVAQDRTVTETREIARDATRKLIDAQQERRAFVSLPIVGEAFDFPLIVGT